MNKLVREARDAQQLPPPAEARSIRVGARITQREAAKAGPMHRVTLSRYENGAGEIRDRRVRANYARFLASLRSELTHDPEPAA